MSTIRAADIDDAEAAATVQCGSALVAYAGIFPADGPKPTPLLLRPGWERLLGDPSTAVLAAEDPEGIVGVVALTPDDTVPTRMLLTRLYVDPSW